MKNEQLPVVSIIVPIYNVEKYLNRCLNTIINQTYSNLEIILVDDGSPDNCPIICDEWAKKDKRIKVIHKLNQGLGMARNSGLKIATGEYVLFIDSDDYIDLTTVDKCLNNILKHNSQIVIYGINKVDENGKVYCVETPSNNKRYYYGDEIISEVLPHLIADPLYKKNKWTIGLCAWNCMYSKKLLDDNKFQFVSEREIISEDFYSIIELYKNVRRVSILNHALYYYCENPTSLTKKFDKNRLNRINDFFIKIENNCKKIGYNNNIIDVLVYPYLSNVIGALKSLVTSEISEDEKTKIIVDYLENPLVIRILKNKVLKRDSVKRKIFYFCMKRKMTKLLKSMLKY